MSYVIFMPFVLFPTKKKTKQNLPVSPLRPSVLGSTPASSFEGPRTRALATPSSC